MFTMSGKYNFANIMLNDPSYLDASTKEQIQTFLT